MPLATEYRSGRNRIMQVAKNQIPDDTRGYILMFEEPIPNASYVIGVDAAVGIAGWSPFSRTDNDNDTDNSAVVVMRVGYGRPPLPDEKDARWRPDLQVAGFTAPINPYDLAKVVNLLGHVYAGNSEEQQAQVIIEVYPGPGGPCQVELQERLGYVNLYQSQNIDTWKGSQRKYTYGWYSDRTSMQHLWSRGLTWIHQKGAIFRDPSLIEEFADCEMDTFRNRGAARQGEHDDRVTAALLALWAARRWNIGMVEPDTRPAEKGPQVDWQSSDVSSEKMYAQWDDMFSRMGD